MIMYKQKNEFIRSLFSLLEKEEYLLLKWWGQNVTQLPIETDLDILVRPTCLPFIEQLVSQNPTIKGYQKETQIGVCHYYLFFEEGSYLQIDLLTKFIRKNIIYLSTEEVFQTSRTINGIRTYSLEKLFDHVLLFNFLNNQGVPPKYKTLFEGLSSATQSNILNHLSTKYNILFQDISDFIFNKTVKTTLKKHISGYKENRLKNRILHGFKFVNFLWRSLKVKQGKIITFSGVDGAGKSTILEATLNLLESKFRKQVVVLRHRPSLLPILSAWKYGKQEAEQRSVGRLPRQGNNSSTLSSTIRFFYYYIDYLIGQFYVWSKYLVRGKIVLYDRYYYDFIIDGKRSNITLPSSFPKYLFHFLQKPTLNFFLYADAPTILKRKKELSSKDIVALTASYHALFQEFSKKYNGKYIPIENKERSQTLFTIEQHFVKQMVG